MTTLTIDRLEARYRLQPEERHARFALDRALRRVARACLAEALDEAALPRDVVVCLSHLRVPIRLSSDEREEDWARRWAQTIVRRIQAASREHRPDVVVYSSKRAARIDAFLCLLVGRTERAWAWRQAGVVVADVGDDTPSLLIGALRSLASDPTRIIELLVELVRRGDFAALMRAVPWEFWPTLAEAAWRAHGGTAAGPPAPRELVSGASASTVDRVRRRSTLWSAFVAFVVRAAATLPAADVGRALGAFAHFALLEDDSSAAARSASRARALVDALVLAAASALREATVDERIDGDDTFDANLRARQLERAEQARFEERSVEAWTAYGGLLFLLRPLAMLGMPERAASDPATAERPIDEVLHYFARHVCVLTPDDPAALAFAGHPPDDPPPTDRPAQPELVAWMDRELEGLRSWLVDVLDGASGDIDPLAWICRRRALVTGEPGWIELAFSHDDANVTLRRTGLDLDPGWIPWLGAVVRFRYV